MKNLFFLFSIFFFSVLVNAQNNKKLDSILKHYTKKNSIIDSLVKASKKENIDTINVEALSRLYNTFLYNTPDLSLRFARQELSVAKKINFIKGIGWALYHIGAYYQNSANIDSARHYYLKSSDIYKNSTHKREYANTLSSLADLETYQGNYDTALSMYDKIISIYDNVNSQYRKAITFGNKANVFINKGNYKLALQEALKALRYLDTVKTKPLRKADALRLVGNIEFLRKNYSVPLKYYLPALAIYTEQKDNVYQANISNDIGNTFFYLKRYDSAKHYLQSSLTLARQYKISDTEGNALLNLGKVYAQQNNYKKAIENLESALSIHQKNRFKANIMSSQNEIANTYLKKGEPKKALSYLSRTIASANVEAPLKELKDAYQMRAIANQQMRQFENAFNDQLEFQILNDSIFNVTKSKQIDELRTIYETEKKEQQITLQGNEIDLLEQKAKVNSLQRILLGVGLLLSLGIVGFGFYGFRQKIKRNKLEKEKLDTELAFKKKELTTHALHLAKKNEVLEGLKQKAEELKSSETSQNGYQQIIRTINFDLQDDNNWENFSKYFQQVHKGFNSNVKQKFPEVTSNELRLMSLLKMNLSSKEIANILNISQEGIKKARYRLRKKLNITTEDSLQDLVLSL